jgi:hypothetical protein
MYPDREEDFGQCVSSAQYIEDVDTVRLLAHVLSRPH